jgi:putative Holliday junction resolvase
MNEKPNMAEMRLLGFDIGSKRIGLAVWNPKARLASPLEVRHRKTLAEDLSYFKSIITREKIEALVVGIPTTLGGKESISTENARFWVQKLETEMALPVFTTDESLSSKNADELMRSTTPKTKQKEKRDSIAAALILEEFLNGLAQ